MNILLVGMKQTPNQFTRAIESYQGLTWTHVHSKLNAEVQSCDVALLATIQLSHGCFYDAKDQCKVLGKPFLIVGESFTQVQERFEKLLIALGHPVIRKPKSMPAPDTAMAQALAKAQRKADQSEETLPPTHTTQEKPLFTLPTDRKFLTTPEIYVYAKQQREKGCGYREIVDDLTRRGFLSARTSQPYQPNSIQVLVSKGDNGILPGVVNQQIDPSYRPIKVSAAYREKFGLKEKSRGPKAEPKVVEETAEPAPSARASANARKGSSARQLEMIGKVLSSDMPMQKKLEMVEEIQAGVRTVEHQVIAERKNDHLQITMQSIFHGGDKPLILIDKITAVAILKVLGEIKDFVNG